MPIYRGDTEVTPYLGDTALAAVYVGDDQVWTAAVQELLCVDNDERCSLAAGPHHAR